MDKAIKQLKLRDIIAYIVGILLLVIVGIKIFTNKDYLSLISDISYVDMIVSLFLSFFLFFTNGCIIAYLTQRHYKTPIKLIDITMLPFMMHFWSFILPFRGGLIFAVLFLKKKYHIKPSEGIAIGVYTSLISLIITGLCGLYYAYYNNFFFSVWTVVSMSLVFSPIIFKMIEKGLGLIPLKKFPVFNNIKKIISVISFNAQNFFSDYKTSTTIFLFTCASIVTDIVLVYWITNILNMNIPLDVIVMFSLMMRLSILIRIVPGNIGIQELLSGGVFYFLGGSLNNGLLIALFVRFLALLLTFSLGPIGTAGNIKYFTIRDIITSWRALNQKDIKTYK